MKARWVRVGEEHRRTRHTFLVDSATHPEIAELLLSASFGEKSRIILELLQAGLAERKRAVATESASPTFWQGQAPMHEVAALQPSAPGPAEARAATLSPPAAHDRSASSGGHVAIHERGLTDRLDAEPSSSQPSSQALALLMQFRKPSSA